MAKTKDSKIYRGIGDLGWSEAKDETPARRPYTDQELVDLRIRYWPAELACDHHPADVVVIWTLLDMLEEQRGWKP